MDVGDVRDVEILRIMDDGRGVAFDEEGKTILISNVTENDKYVNIKITAVFEESYFAERRGISKIAAGKEKKERNDLEKSPYELDEDEGTEDDGG